MHVLVTRSVEETRAIGRRLGEACSGRCVVALIGDLGAGKTALTQGIGEGLEVESLVQSPTFTVIQEHPEARVPLYHMDLYRVERTEDLEQLGIEDALADDAVCVIEWADQHPDVLPVDHLEICIRHLQDGRELTLTPKGTHHEAWLEFALG